ncbi:hypothetical protein [Hansschlegelia zhihuaiae]|uniref:hypothetical protein n=1 Tax=Hansschlegelia zhihuaiae TaxID=405005 RepID=UPI0013E8BEC0|nr:hypothetical protein [Hansschlegelia zhihuaiae]
MDRLTTIGAEFARQAGGRRNLVAALRAAAGLIALSLSILAAPITLYVAATRLVE